MSIELATKESGRLIELAGVESVLVKCFGDSGISAHVVHAVQEYNKSQVASLINLVATVNNWKRKAKVDLLERIETGDYFS